MNWNAAITTAEAIAGAWRDEGGPGGAVILFDAGGTRAIACGGWASIAHALPFGPDTAVRYASISKHFLCATVARDGHMGFGDKLGAHIDAGAAQGGVTVGRALDMTGGIADAMETLWLLGITPTAGMDRHALLRFVRGIEALNFAPGSEISYTNAGYRMVQAVLEAKGVDYALALRERFFRPLGLSMRLPEDETEIVPDLATGYWRGPRGWAQGRYGLHFSASGGITGTARDLAIWAGALLTGRGPAAGLLDLLSAPRALADGRITGYGLGLARSPLGDHELVGHGGSLPGFKNHFLVAPRLGAGVVVVTNREDSDAHGLTLRVMSALTETPEPTPVADGLPEGRFIAEDGPIWIEHQGGTLTYLGAQDTLYGDAGGVYGRSAHMPIRLRQEGGAIVGEIGHAARRFRPATGAGVRPEWEGDWVCPRQNGRLRIDVDGSMARMSIGAGPMHSVLELLPIASDMALVERAGDGPWKQRACLHFTDQGLRLVTNRSRVLRFARAR